MPLFAFIIWSVWFHSGHLASSRLLLPSSGPFEPVAYSATEVSGSFSAICLWHSYCHLFSCCLQLLFNSCAFFLYFPSPSAPRFSLAGRQQRTTKQPHSLACVRGELSSPAGYSYVSWPCEYNQFHLIQDIHRPSPYYIQIALDKTLTVA